MATVNSMRHAHLATIAAADQPATMQRLTQHSNPVVQHAAELMHVITDMHARNDYTHASEIALADDALFYLPLHEIERLVAEYLGGALAH